MGAKNPILPYNILTIKYIIIPHQMAVSELLSSAYLGIAGGIFIGNIINLFRVRTSKDAIINSCHIIYDEFIKSYNKNVTVIINPPVDFLSPFTDGNHIIIPSFMDTTSIVNSVLRYLYRNK
jgi:hypothetical protein